MSFFAARAWRLALPGSNEALRTQLQILTALNRVTDAAEPLGALLAQVSAEERLGLIVSLPRFFQRVGDPRAAATLMEQALKRADADSIAARRAEAGQRGIAEPTTWLMGELGTLLSAKALYRDAERWERRALAIARWETRSSRANRSSAATPRTKASPPSVSGKIGRFPRSAKGIAPGVGSSRALATSS